MAKPVQLGLMSHTVLDPKIHDGMLTYNPTIELFAGAAGARTLQIWRSNGQLVVKSSQRGEKESVQALRWKPNGQFLAVGWSDGCVRLLGLENNKAIHQIPVCEGGRSRAITYIGWAQNCTGRRSSPQPTESVTAALQALSLDGTDEGDRKDVMDLPRELTFLEIETALPKISPLPASGGSGDDMYVFTTRASLEFLFRPLSSGSSDEVDVMVVGTSDGHIHLSIYDSFVIGSFQFKTPGPSKEDGTLRLAAHASHPDLSTHSLVFQSVVNGGSNVLYVVPWDLTFIYSSPENLSLLAFKTTTLQKLLRYVKQVQMRMLYEWQTTRELPSKFLNSINETLKEAGTYGDMDIGQAMYHSVVTGHTFPEVKEWLVDQLAERGHKRWDKAVVSGLEGLRSLIHENFLPSLERIALILSRLLGIARFHDSKDGIGFTAAQVTKVMDIVSCLMLVGNKILLLVMEELELFHSFSTWLRFEIDRLASSTISEELSEKEATMEHGKILTYIQQYMKASPLRAYLSSVSPKDSGKDRQQAEDGSSVLEMLDKQIRSQELGQPEGGVLPQVEFLVDYLVDKASAVFNGIAEAERRSVRFGQPTRIELENRVSKLDVSMSITEHEVSLSLAYEMPASLLHSLIPFKNTINSSTFTAVSQDGQPSNVHIYRTDVSVVNGISGDTRTSSSCLSLGDATIIDIKFLHGDSLLALISVNDEMRIIRIPHQSAELGYTDYVTGQSTVPHVLSTEQVTSVFPNMIVPADEGWDPVQMEIRGASKQRGHLPARVCLLGEEMQHYRVFGLPEKLV
ncbi:Anaphase-promoting complex component Cut20/Apc4 [Apiospora rasikravindrae]|uniref:Anaphase-promoting complex subunit 4 n=1 Tax=Apiospora rasikravindrae TaxID=990691 RepID=A0ABR1RW45_9PEZI